MYIRHRNASVMHENPHLGIHFHGSYVYGRREYICILHQDYELDSDMGTDDRTCLSVERLVVEYNSYHYAIDQPSHSNGYSLKRKRRIDSISKRENSCWRRCHGCSISCHNTRACRILAAPEEQENGSGGYSGYQRVVGAFRWSIKDGIKATRCRWSKDRLSCLPRVAERRNILGLHT